MQRRVYHRRPLLYEIKCIVWINPFKMNPAKIVLVLDRAVHSIFFLGRVNPAVSLQKCAKALLPCSEGFKNMLLSDASTRCLWGLTCHVEEMDLGNGPATVWVLGCHTEQPAETMGKRTGSRIPRDLWMGGGIPLHVILVLISLDGCWETSNDVVMKIEALSWCIKQINGIVIKWHFQSAIRRYVGPEYQWPSVGKGPI